MLHLFDDIQGFTHNTVPTVNRVVSYPTEAFKEEFMKVLDRYMFKEFLKIFTMTVLSFLSLYLLVDIFELIDDLLEHHVPLSISVQMFIYKTPDIFYQISPVAVLMATLLTMGILSRHSEITAVKAGGISIIRCIVPLLLCGLLISVMNIILNETVIPITNKRTESIKREWFEKSPTKIFNQNSVWFRDTNGIYTVRYMDTKAKVVKGFTMYNLDLSFNLKTKLHADELIWTDDRWLITSGLLWRFSEKEGIKATKINNVPLQMLGGPEEIGRAEANPKEMSFSVLYRYIVNLKKEGYEIKKYLVDLYSKTSFPFVNLIMVLLGIPFSLTSGKRSGLALGVTVTVLIGFSYWIVFGINMSLGYSGVIPPLVASWFTNIIFGAIGLLMLSHVRH
jgi:lipopolysaccharide export system permease protein